MSIPIKAKEKKKRLPLEPLAPQESVRNVPCWITLLKIYIWQYLSCVFWGPALLLLSLKGVQLCTSLHTSKHSIADTNARVWRSQGRKPTWIYESVLLLSAHRFGMIHEATARSNDAWDGARKKNKIHRIFNSNHFANLTGTISEEQHVERWICNF